jgi:hypothetical protein
MKILFFSPHAYYDVHALPEALVADALRKEGNKILTINCDGLYKDYCISMSAVKFSDLSAKAAICNKCKNNRDIINEKFNFQSILLESLISKEELFETERILNTLNKENYINYEFDSVPIAKFAIYEFILNHKLSSTNIPNELWGECKAHIRNAMNTYFAMTRFMKYEQPERVVVYNSLYGVNRIVCAVAEKCHIPDFMLHAGYHLKYRLQQMLIFKGIGSLAAINTHKYLDEKRFEPLPKKNIRFITEHVKALLQAKSPWVYSVPSQKMPTADVKRLIGIELHQKVILAVMRSNDERFGARLAGCDFLEGNPIFSSQIEWLNWLCEFALQNPSYFIIFRVHPREYPNKREGVISEHSVSLEKHISNRSIPSNVYINLPSDNLSLHDLLKITDVLLNNTSSVGLEASLLGIPVIGYGDSLLSFDKKLQRECFDVEEYIKVIHEKISLGWQFSNVISAYRWINFLNQESAIDISDGFRHQRSTLNLFLRVINKCLRGIGKSSSKLTILMPVIFRSSKLKSHKKLVYSIMNNTDSHTGFIVSKNQPATLDDEYDYIRRDFKEYVNLISGNHDEYFNSKINQLMNTDYTLAS